MLAGLSTSPIPSPVTTMLHHCAPTESSVSERAQRKKPTAATAQPSTTGGRAPIRSSIRPPNWAPVAKPAKKISRYSPVSAAVSPSEICAYMLAKKNIGTNGIISRKRIALSTAKARSAKLRTWISGWSTRSS